jgi:hypothetical protein
MMKKTIQKRGQNEEMENKPWKEIVNEINFLSFLEEKQIT